MVFLLDVILKTDKPPCLLQTHLLLSGWAETENEMHIALLQEKELCVLGKEKSMLVWIMKIIKAKKVQKVKVGTVMPLTL